MYIAITKNTLTRHFYIVYGWHWHKQNGSELPNVTVISLFIHITWPSSVFVHDKNYVKIQLNCQEQTSSEAT